MIKAVIFDMDGVLIEAKDWHYEALNKALRLFGFEINRYAHLTAYDGLPTKTKLDMLTREAGLPHELHAFINEMKQQYTMDIALQQCKPRFAHEYALSRLKSDGYKLGVASNSIRSTVEALMRLSHLSGYLDVMLSNEDVKKSKPDPEMYLKAIEALGLEAKQCLVVEDNENGIKAARGSGAYVMVVGAVAEVTYRKISLKIADISKGQPC